MVVLLSGEKKRCFRFFILTLMDPGAVTTSSLFLISSACAHADSFGERWMIRDGDFLALELFIPSI